MEITVDDAVKEHIISEGMDYRLCTTCSGPALVPTLIKGAKKSDIMIPVGEGFTLFVSAVQASYISHITMDLIYDPEKLFSCSSMRSIRDLME